MGWHMVGWHAYLTYVCVSAFRYMERCVSEPTKAGCQLNLPFCSLPLVELGIDDALRISEGSVTILLTPCVFI